MREGHSGKGRGGSDGCLSKPLAALYDPEQSRVPAGLPAIIDAHVHVFPNPLLQGLWDWFERYAWPIRYKLAAQQVVDFLLQRGVEQIVLLHYAHKAGIARQLNAFVAALCRDEPRLVGLGTVLPGEPGAGDILEEAFASGLQGVKLHCHVQCFAPDAPEMREVYQACVAHDKPLVIHAGREPKSPAYRCDPHALCSAERIERVLSDYPTLALCVPHLGYDELDAYGHLLQRFDNLWLDTSVALARFLDDSMPRELLTARPDRVMYGSDFPHLPYAWDRELTAVARLGLDQQALTALLAGNARTFFQLQPLEPTVAVT